MIEDFNKSMSINLIYDQYLANYPDRINANTKWWVNEDNNVITAINNELDTNPKYPSDEFEHLLITPNEYYANLTGDIANNLTDYTSNAIIPNNDTIIETKKPIYFWVPTLKNWCRYYSCEDFKVNNYKTNPWNNAFIYMAQWNGVNGWIPFINLNNLNQFNWLDLSNKNKFNFYKYANLKNKNYYTNRKIISNITGNYYVYNNNNVLMNCLDGYFLLNSGEKFSDKNINTFETLKMNKVYIDETRRIRNYAQYIGRAIIPTGLLVLNKYASSIPKLSYFQIIEGSRISTLLQVCGYSDGRQDGKNLQYKFYPELLNYINQSLQNLFGAGDDYTIEKMLNWNENNIIESDNLIDSNLENNKIEISHNVFNISLSINNINMTASRNSGIPIANRY